MVRRILIVIVLMIVILTDFAGAYTQRKNPNDKSEKYDIFNYPQFMVKPYPDINHFIFPETRISQNRDIVNYSTYQNHAQPLEPTCTPVIPEDELLTSEYTPGPLVDKIPDFDAEGIEAIIFKSDMEKIVDKAVKVSGIDTTFGIFIMDLQSGMYYGVNEDLTQIDPADNVPEGYFNSASVIKLFQGYIICDMLRNKELEEDKVYYDEVIKRKFKLLPMIKNMISYSDNNYSNACLRIVGNKRSNEVLTRLGITNSRLYGEMSGAIGYSRENNIKKYGTDKRCARVTPKDTGLILYNIYWNKKSDPYMKVLNQALLGNIYNSRIPAGVRRVSPKYYIAHKTGTNSSQGIYNDAGIVYTKNPFILVVYTQGTTSKKGHAFIQNLAENLTRYFVNKLP